MTKKKILIVDDSLINQEILADIVSQVYDVEFANDGQEVLTRLDEVGNEYFSLILLDLMMPVMDGYTVLERMQRATMLENLPVIVISSETDSRQIERAYDLGAIDFINRPFEGPIVLRRIENTLALYSKKKNLEDLLIRQFFEKEKNNQHLIDVLANLVEFRNGETAAHIIHIRAFTSIILHTLKGIAPQYNLTSELITYIINASSLHDIGKISIPTEILNKPGKLTPEEFEVMKTHSAEGARILKESQGFKTSRQIRVAHDICRWHHERFDGHGYPDGLKGEEIPIGAQVVSLADVYDALISERCYKPAYSHEKAIQMILNGECGVFNPMLIETLKILEPQLKKGFDQAYLDKIEAEEISHTGSTLLKTTENDI